MTATHHDVQLLNRAREQIGKLIEDRAAALIQGVAGDYADYRGRSGEINGLKTALNILGEIVRQMGDQRS